MDSSSYAWPTLAAEYKLQRRIGNGAFSSVWKASCSKNSLDVAIKIMDLEHISTSFEDILQEVQTMRLCENENVLRCFCSFVQKDQLWLVTQLMDRGSCLRVMNVARHYGFGEGMNEEWLAYILREALQGIRYLHENGQIHRDIKSGNILLDAQGNVRIADFGVSGWTISRGQRQDTVKTFVGTPCWMAPEVMEQLEGYDCRADIWSFGITALELAKGSAPYAKYPPMRVLVLTIEEDPPSLKSYDTDRQRTGAPFSRMFEDFVKKCLQKAPKSRPSADELLKHKFLKGRSKDALLHQLLDHITPVGSGEGNENDEADSSIGSSAASFFRDAGSVGSKTSLNTPDIETQSCGPELRDKSTCYDSASIENEVSNSNSRSGTGKVTFTTSLNSESSIVDPAGESSEKEFVSGTTWVFDNSFGESGVFSGDGSKDGRKKELSDDEDDVGEFLDGFDRETATLKSSSISSENHKTATGHLSHSKSGGSSDDYSNNSAEHYNMPPEGSMVVLDCGSLVSSLNSRENDDTMGGLLDGNCERSELLGTAKENVFEFDDRKKSDELIAQSGHGPGPLLSSMDNKMVSSLDGHEALKRLIGSGYHRKPAETNSTATVNSVVTKSSGPEKKEEDDEDIDVFLDGFEEETADMNF